MSGWIILHTALMSYFYKTLHIIQKNNNKKMSVTWIISTVQQFSRWSKENKWTDEALLDRRGDKSCFACIHVRKGNCTKIERDRRCPGIQSFQSVAMGTKSEEPKCRPCHYVLCLFRYRHLGTLEIRGPHTSEDTKLITGHQNSYGCS